MEGRVRETRAMYYVGFAGFIGFIGFTGSNKPVKPMKPMKRRLGDKETRATYYCTRTSASPVSLVSLVLLGSK